MDATEVRQWIRGFEAIAEADRQAARRHGADPSWAIAIALSMIDAADRAGKAPAASDPAREREDGAVRATWARLRERLGR